MEYKNKLSWSMKKATYRHSKHTILLLMIFVLVVWNWINLYSRSMSPGWFHIRPLGRKIKKSVFDFGHLLFFVTRPIFGLCPTLSRYNFETEARSLKPTIFSESWVCSVGLAPKKIPIENFWVQSVLPKKSLFRQFPCTHIKNIARIANAVQVTL